jgi:hypothetical protein
VLEVFACVLLLVAGLARADTSRIFALSPKTSKLGLSDLLRHTFTAITATSRSR